MCGIFGLFKISEDLPSEELLKRSVSLIDHRGPDAQNVLALPGLGLAHARLSFLDMDARSNQPFADETGRYLLVYNGEVYNFQAIRNRLEQQGITFRTQSDTEVVLLSLIHDGIEEGLLGFDGMFAFAFYDRQEEKLVLGRDRFGMKPLFYYEFGGDFFFTSEVKALEPWVDLAPDMAMISSYLLGFRGPTNRSSFFADIRALEPGSFLLKRRGSAPEIASYGRIQSLLDDDEAARWRAANAGQIVDAFDERINKSVQMHLMADVPIGAFCSGGVDSSLIMAVAAKTHSNLSIFHANVVGKWSEKSAATDLARHLKLDVNIADIEERHFLSRLPITVRHFEQPIADRPNCVPMMMVAQLARDKGVKGLLSGEGSDECFLGYPWLGRKRLIDAVAAFGKSAFAVIPGMKLLREVFGAGDPILGHAVSALLNRREQRDDDATIAALTRDGRKLDDYTRWTLEYLHHHLRILFHRNDTMGMAASIESRFPFLSADVVSFAVNLPGEYKLRRDLKTFSKAHPFIRDKWVVREVASRYIPAELSGRTKFGFWTTVFNRFECTPEYFSHSILRDIFRISQKQLDATVEEGPSVLRQRLLHLDVWARMCLNGEAADTVSALLVDGVRIRPE